MWLHIICTSASWRFSKCFIVAKIYIELICVSDHQFQLAWFILCASLYIFNTQGTVCFCFKNLCMVKCQGAKIRSTIFILAIAGFCVTNLLITANSRMSARYQCMYCGHLLCHLKSVWYKSTLIDWLSCITLHMKSLAIYFMQRNSFLHTAKCRVSKNFCQCFDLL